LWKKQNPGGGALIDIGVHALDLALWLAGNFKISSVSGVAYNNFGHRDVDDQAVAFIRLKDDTIINLDTSWEAFTKDEVSIQVFGTKAGAITDPFIIYSSVGNKPAIIHSAIPQKTPNAEMIGLFVERIFKKEEYLTSAEEGLTVMKILDAIYASSRQKKEVKIK